MSSEQLLNHRCQYCGLTASDPWMMCPNCGKSSVEPAVGERELPPERTIAESFFRRWSCYHSMLVADCPGCLQGHAARMENELHKLEVELAAVRAPQPDDGLTRAIEAATAMRDEWARKGCELNDYSIIARAADEMITAFKAERNKGK